MCSKKSREKSRTALPFDTLVKYVESYKGWDKMTRKQTSYIKMERVSRNYGFAEICVLLRGFSVKSSFHAAYNM